MLFLATVMKYLNKQSSLDLIEHAKAVCLLGMKNVYQILEMKLFVFQLKMVEIDAL